MRISVTDRCNMKCVYCMPEKGTSKYESRQILTYEEIIRLIEAASELGVHKVRLTGGEPLLRRDLHHLIKGIKDIHSITDLSLTTNGILLEEYAKKLVSAGLDRVNVSLDSLIPERYKYITRGGEIKWVLRGIQSAFEHSLLPVKINMVPMRGINDDEIEEFARLTLDSSHHVRFIEFMPVGNNNNWNKNKYISTEEIKQRVEKILPITPIRLRKSGPARYYRFKDAKGVIGFISAITHHFCDNCNRLRLTSDGKLMPCLFSETEIDIKTPLRNGASREEIKRLLCITIEVKPKGHNLRTKANNISSKTMSKIGG